MIPNFPDFKCLTWNDKEEVGQFTKDFPPYSDFNFTSLYAWNIDDKVKVSKLNGNLVVLFSDYLTGKPFLSFLGCKNVSDTASSLIEYSRSNFNEPSLKLVPEIVVHSLCAKTFTISEDRDSFDYIYSTSNFYDLPQWPAKYRASQQARTFIKTQNDYYTKCFSIREIDSGVLLKLYKQWAFNRGIDYLATNEFRAFQRLFIEDDKTSYSLILYIAGVPKGFVLFEILPNKFAINHFSKADISYKGIYETMHWHTAKTLYSKGI